MNAEVDLSDVRLETERLILRAWEPEDLEDLYAYAKDPETAAGAGWPPHRSRDESRRILRLFIEEKQTLAIMVKRGQRVIGSLALDEIREELPASLEPYKGRELGYVLHKDYWGRGLMTEAVKALIRRCFQHEDYDFLAVGHFAENLRSARVIEKCAFRYYKTFTIRSDDKRRHVLKYYLLLNGLDASIADS